MPETQSNESLRSLQLHELKILKAIKAVCEKNGLTYYLDSGTLLGAVRHRGFIPWDDDIDIIMPFPDYTKFLKIAQGELGEDFFVQNSETDPNFYCLFTKVRLNHTTMMPVNHTHYHVHHGIWVDVFPLVNMNEREINLKRKAIKICHTLLMQDYIAANPEEFKSILGTNMYRLVQLLYHIPVNIRKRLRRQLMRYVLAAKTGDSYSVVWTSIDRAFPKNIFEKTPKTVMFEGEEFPAPNEYKRYLELLYGDYMTPPPESERKAHGSLILDFENSWETYLR